MQVGVLPHDRDPHLMLRMHDSLDDGLPGSQIGFLGLEPESLADHAVESLIPESDRDFVDRRHVGALDDALEIDVAEAGDLALDLGTDRLFAAADQDVGLDSDLHQVPHRVLGRLGLELAGRRDVGHQGQMDEQRVVAPHLLAELTDRLEERQRFDVSHRAADLGDNDVVPRRAAPDGILDLVGDVGDDLNGGTEVLAAAFLADDCLVDPCRW